MSHQSQQRSRRRPPKNLRARRVVSSIILLVLLLLGFIGLMVGAVRVVGQIIGGLTGGEDPEPQAFEEPLAPEPVTPQLDFTGFDPGNIISDEVFYADETMDREEIQAFLDKVGEGCRQGADGSECLASYREDSPTFDATDYCFAFEGQSDDTAASIIFKAANACGINPQVLLVMLQKEQGLLTASGSRLDEGRYSISMGYGCPDNANCNPAYFGFGNQVYHAAKQLRMYANSPQKYQIEPFADNKIAFHPSSDCGRAMVYIENYATAGLYNYTPYQPDEAALAGQPASCSAVGNLNFYAYFNAWFSD